MQDELHCDLGGRIAGAAWCMTACRCTHVIMYRPLLPDVVVQVPSLAVRHDETEVPIVFEELFIRHDVRVPQESQDVGLSQGCVSITFAGLVERDPLEYIELVVLIVACLEEK